MKVLSHADLKQRHRLTREDQPADIRLRIHRALSWLNRAEQSHNDLDGQFIFLWISFNAAYSNLTNPDNRKPERSMFEHFLSRVCEMDKDKAIYKVIWKEFPNSIRVLLNNKYVFQPFWDFHNGFISERRWIKRFNKAKKDINYALGKNNTGWVLSIVFSRLYTLRNQILHGGATWNSQVNREQMRDAVAILSQLIPLIIKTLMDNPNQFIGEAVYQVID